MCTPHGEVAERFKAAVLKTVEVSQPPGVRIPPSPPDVRVYDNDILGRCQRGRMGPPAKRLRADKVLRGFESLPSRTGQHRALWPGALLMV
jgi:hypothetical protein